MLLMASGNTNSSLTRIKGIVSPDMGQIISKGPLPKATISTDEVVVKPINFQSVKRWEMGKPMKLTHMALWDKIAPPNRSPLSAKWSKGALVNVTV